MILAHASQQIVPVSLGPEAEQKPTEPRQAMQRICDLLAGCSIEVTPAVAAKHPSLGSMLPAGTRVYVAFVPGEDYRDVVRTAARIRADGLVPVPHFPARSIAAHRARALSRARHR